jgi:hypothetical protein
MLKTCALLAIEKMEEDNSHGTVSILKDLTTPWVCARLVTSQITTREETRPRKRNKKTKICKTAAMRDQ